MKLVLQRVSHAKVTVEDRLIGEIKKGILILLGIGHDDAEADMDALIEKTLNLRIFEDAEGKMNLSLLDVAGSLLVVSQFTLYADCSKGRRPSFGDAMAPEPAGKMYTAFVEKCRNRGIKTETGEFGAHMLLDFVNDGPVTILL